MKDESISYDSKIIVDKEHPYLGLEYFREENKEFFFGRTDDLQKLLKLIQRNVVTVLSGESGLGKTSLIKAGLMPELRNASYFPVYLRLKFDDQRKTVSGNLKSVINQQCKMLDPSLDDLVNETLWEYFHKVKILNGYVIPVLIFDQFEELFTRGASLPDQINEFITELTDLVENQMPLSFQAAYQDKKIPFDFNSQNYRILFSLREDFLARLETLSIHMPSLKKSRYRIVQMSRDQALEAIYKPGKEIISLENSEKILDLVFRNQAENKKEGEEVPQMDIEPFLLSLFCFEINNKRIEENQSEISVDLLNRIEIKDIISVFYRNKTKELPQESINLLEDGLLTQDGYRKLQPIGDITHSGVVKEAHINNLIDNRILRKEIWRGMEHIELIHDSLIEPILKARKRRLEKVESEKAEAERAKAEAEIAKDRAEREEKLRQKEIELEAQKKRLREQRLATTISIVFLIIAVVAFVNARFRKKEADINRTTAEEKTKNLKNVIDKMYFYGDKFALTYKRGFFGFIDTLGNEQLDFIYDEASPFNEKTGLARVSKGDSYYLIDTAGNEYLLSKDITYLWPETQVLELSNRYLKDIDEVIYNYDELRILLLNRNEIERISAGIGKMKNLILLDFNHNKLSTLPEEISKLLNLTFLDLSDNQINTLPPGIGKLEKLTSLNLSGNQINTLPPGIGKLEKLTSLNLSVNQLNTLPPGIGNLEKLTFLDLSGNQIRILPPEIGNLANLTFLYLSGSQLNTLPPEIGNLANLTFLYLSGSQLHTLPPEISSLANLTFLNLSGNQISTLPPEIGKLEKLTFLDLSDNKLNTLPPEIGKLEKLTFLDLSDNKLNTLPRGIGKLEELTSLNLSGNQLNTLPPEIGNLANLTFLYLSDNKLNTLPKGIGKLEKLTFLNLSGNQLNTLPPEIGNLANLTFLDLSGNQIRILPPEIWNLANLRTINLSGNQLQTLPPEIGNLANLTFLYLSGSQLNTLPPEISSLANLTFLNLSGNQLHTLPPEIGNLVNLASLDLSGNQLNTLPLEIGNLTLLRSLYLMNNNLSKEEQEKIKKIIPSCYISF